MGSTAVESGKKLFCKKVDPIMTDSRKIELSLKMLLGMLQFLKPNYHSWAIVPNHLSKKLREPFWSRNDPNTYRCCYPLKLVEKYRKKSLEMKVTSFPIVNPKWKYVFLGQKLIYLFLQSKTYEKLENRIRMIYYIVLR